MSIFSFLTIVVFFICLIWALHEDKIHRSLHTRGRMDVIEHKDECDKYSGLRLWSYQRGRTVQERIHEGK